VIAFAAFVASGPAFANQSQFRGAGWYICETDVADVVDQGPFKSKDLCVRAIARLYPHNGDGLYCRKLSGPV
jgi:hypothetical protein